MPRIDTFVQENVTMCGLTPEPDRYGDWGLAMVLYLARRRSGLTLSEIGSLAGGMHYKAVFAQVKRMESKMNTDPELQDKMEDCERKL